MSAAWDRVIGELEHKKTAIESVVNAMKEMRKGLSSLPPEIAKTVLDAFREQGGLDSGKTNFDRIVQFLRSQSEPQTIKKIINGTGMTKTALMAVLYHKKHRDAFIKEKTGDGKTLAWNVRDLLIGGKS